MIEDFSRLLRVSYRGATDTAFGLKYTMLGDYNGGKGSDKAGQPQSSDINLSESEYCKALTWHEFPPGVSWAPERVEVNGRKGRRIVCVLAEDRHHYRVYDLDGALSVGVEEEEGVAQDARTEASDEIMS